MNVHQDLRSFTTLGFLGSVLVLSALPPETRAQGGLPTAIELTGVVRDFSQAHSDFSVSPLAGYEHCAGNIDLSLNADGRPTFIGAGFKVDSQWRDVAGRPIAPHLYQASSSDGTVPLVDAPTMQNKAVADTYDSSLGPYGGSNVGPAPTFITGSPMPALTEPSGLPYTDDVIYLGQGTSVISDNIHCKTFVVQDQHTVQISGDVTIICDELFKVQNYGAVLELLPGASLTIYVKKDAFVQDQAQLNSDTAQPARVTIYNLGVNDFVIQDQASVCATMISPAGRLYLHNGGDFYGNFEGKTIYIQNQAGFHADEGAGATACGTPMNDSSGVAGVASSGEITSADTFDQWFQDVLGVNLSKPHPITLTNDGAGVYEYLEDTFHPIDGALLGNDGDSHNYNFTYAIAAEFTYEGCAGQFVEFRGADDVWLFIDGSLALDVGGVGGIMDEQYIELDRLGLIDGQSYQFQFFYAQRQLLYSMFRLRTNLLMESMLPTISAPFD